MTTEERDMELFACMCGSYKAPNLVKLRKIVPRPDSGGTYHGVMYCGKEPPASMRPT
jgi:hypothetical protein